MDLNELRNEINAIDDEILKLFLRRMDVAEQVADYKRAHDLPIYQPQREQEILESVSERAGELGNYARSLFSTLMELSKQYQAARGETP
jgi:chorismate mutase/prephenate dehydratase